MIFKHSELQRFRADWAAIMDDERVVRYLAEYIQESDGRIEFSRQQRESLCRLTEAVLESRDGNLDLGPERRAANALLGHLLAQAPEPDRSPCKPALEFAKAVSVSKI